MPLQRLKLQQQEGRREMLISEPTGLYVLPLAMKLSANAYDLIFELNLFMIPFVIMMIFNIFAARAQGQDEGSPAVLALKKIEVAGIAMIAVMLLFNQPWQTKPKFIYNQYSCSKNPSILSSEINASDITGSDRFNGYINNIPNLPILTGIIHDFATGINGALTSKIPCKTGANIAEVSDSLSKMIPAEEVLYESILTFNQQCYIPALANIKEEQQKGNNLIFDPKTFSSSPANPDKKNEYFSFNSVPMKSAYTGMIGRSPAGDLSPYPSLTVSTGEYWYASGQRNSTLSCADVASPLAAEMKSDILKSENYADTKRSIMDYVGMYQPVSGSDIDNEMINVMYQNVVGNLAGSREASFEESKRTLNGARFAHSSPSIERSVAYVSNSTENKETAGNMFINALVFVGSIFKGLEETTKAHAALIIMPSLIMVVLGVIIAAIPIISLLSGYSFSAMYQVMLFYFGVCVVPYWLNVGVYFQSLLAGLIDTSLPTMEKMGLTIVGQYMTYMSPLLWLFLFQVLGTMAGSMLASALQESTGAGDQAYKQVQAMIDRVKKAGIDSISGQTKNIFGNGQGNNSSGSGPTNLPPP